MKQPESEQDSKLPADHPKPGTRIDAQPGHRYRYFSKAEHALQPTKSERKMGGYDKTGKLASASGAATGGGGAREAESFELEFKSDEKPSDKDILGAVKLDKKNVKRIFVNTDPDSIKDRFDSPEEFHGELENLKKQFPDTPIVYGKHIKGGSDGSKSAWEVTEPPFAQQKQSETPAQPEVKQSKIADHPAAKTFHASIDESKHLSPELKQEHREAINKVFHAMPKAAHEAINKNVKSSHFFSKGSEIIQSVIDDHPEDKNDSESDLNKSLAYGDQLVVGGSYSPDTQKMRLDGKEVIAASGETGDMSHLHAHELGHAIDGPEMEHSTSYEWRDSYENEIQGDANKLNKYAAEEGPQEGFAEFTRHVYVGDMSTEEIESRFPNCSQYFKEKGLWPAHREKKQ